MSKLEQTILTINGVKAKAFRRWLREDPSQTPAGQPTVPPREYRLTPEHSGRGFQTALNAKITDRIEDADEEGCDLAITYMRREYQPGTKHINAVILRSS